MWLLALRVRSVRRLETYHTVSVAKMATTGNAVERKVTVRALQSHVVCTPHIDVWLSEYITHAGRGRGQYYQSFTGPTGNASSE